MILGSTNISTLKLGSSAVQKVMLGATEVWSNFDPDFAAYLAAGIVNGSTMGAANQTAVNAFIVGCKADGIWSAIKASCLLCAWDSLAGALTPLVGAAPTNFNFDANDYSRTTGLKGDGSTKYLNSNRNNNADPQDSRHLYTSMTVADTTTASLSWYIGGVFINGGSYVAKANAAGTSHSFRSAGSNLNRTVSRATGGWGVGRQNSSEVERLAAGSIDTFANASAIPASHQIGVFATGLGATPTDSRLSFYSIGEGLDLTLLDARLTTLMAALT